MSQQNVLYRFFDANDELLYVGISMTPWERFRQHRQDKSWWVDIRKTTMEPYPSRAAVMAAERTAIIEERPRYNVVHNRGNGVIRKSFSGERFSFIDQSGNERRGQLQLVYEVMGDPISDDYNARWESAEYVFNQWVDWYDRIWSREKVKGSARYPRQCVPISWFVVGCAVFEAAQPTYLSLDGDHRCEWFGDFYTRPYSLRTGAPIKSMKEIPVEQKRWSPGLSHKGGFITEATGWRPFPLQRWVDLEQLQTSLAGNRASA